MDAYSLTLPLAFAAALAALGLALLSRRFAARGRLRFSAWGAGLTALALAFVSAASHVSEGHRPGSPAALAPGAFLAEHPALLVASALAASAIVLLSTTRPHTVTRNTLEK